VAVLERGALEERPVIGEGLARALARRFSREEAEVLALAAGFLATAAIVAAFGLVAAEVFALSGTDPLDEEVTLWARSLAIPGGTAAAHALSFLGDWRFLVPATASATAVLAWRGRRVSAMLFVASVLGGFGLEILLKAIFQRPRPNLVAPLASVSTYSFPSGHATMVTVFFGGLAAVVFHVTARPAPRAVAALGAALAITSVGLSRITLGVHWLTDVAAGILVGLFWVSISATATELVAGSRRQESEARTSPPSKLSG
jgi:undecaprenyl-diphosphatase